MGKLDYSKGEFLILIATVQGYPLYFVAEAEISGYFRGGNTESASDCSSAEPAAAGGGEEKWMAR